MPRQLWLADKCRQWGLATREVDGWTTRGTTSLLPVGVMAHHTAGPSTGELPSLGTLINGRPDLAGPLCQVGLGRSGTVYIVAAGRANHAGEGNWGGATGNSSFLGIEAENNGRQPWPDVQLQAYFTLCAALSDGIHQQANMVCGHKEYATPPGRKPDPHTLDMHAFRTRVQQLLIGGDMPWSDAQISEVVIRLQQIHGVITQWRGEASDTNPGTEDLFDVVKAIRNKVNTLAPGSPMDPAVLADQIVAKLGPNLASAVASKVIELTRIQYNKP